MEAHLYIIRNDSDQIVVSRHNRTEEEDEAVTYTDLFSKKRYKVDYSTRKIISVDEVDSH